MSATRVPQMSSTESSDSVIAYEPPRLTVLGPLEELTAGGMGADTDVTSSQPT